MISDGKNRILRVENDWIMCPDCGRGRLMPLLPETRGRMIPAYCKRCKTQHMLTITASACADVPEPADLRRR